MNYFTFISCLLMLQHLTHSQPSSHTNSLTRSRLFNFAETNYCVETCKDLNMRKRRHVIAALLKKLTPIKKFLLSRYPGWLSMAKSRRSLEFKEFRDEMIEYFCDCQAKAKSSMETRAGRIYLRSTAAPLTEDLEDTPTKLVSLSPICTKLARCKHRKF